MPPEALDFNHHFWGAKHEGFSVLYHNLKNGATAAKELADFLKELSKVQEDAAKSHLKIVKQFGQSGGSTGTFAPILVAWKGAAERLATLHHAWTLKLNDLIKEVLKYVDDQHRVHKKVKEEESATADAVKLFQDTVGALQKAKDVYKQRHLELEKHRREGASAKETEKSEAKLKRAQDDYKTLVDKFNGIRDDFESKMVSSTQRFQTAEATHLGQMREFVEAYCLIVDDHHHQQSRIHQGFQIELSTLGVNDLLMNFIRAKTTGQDRPGAVDFEEERMSLTSGAVGPPSDVSDKSGNSADKVSLGSVSASGSIGTLKKEGSGFLRRKQKKDKEKKKKVPSKDGTEDLEPEAHSDEDSQGLKSGSQPATLDVDDEGYSKPPPVAETAAPSDPWAEFLPTRKRFNSSSSDDSDDESRRRKIKVEIKPVEMAGQPPISASVDELRTVIGGLELLPKPKDLPTVYSASSFDPSGGSNSSLLRRSVSQSYVNKPSQDLLGLSLAPSGKSGADINDDKAEPTVMNAAASSNLTQPGEDPHNVSNGSSSTLNTSTNKEVGDIFAGGAFPKDPQPALPVKQRPSSVQREKISNSLIALPRPPSRHGSVLVNAITNASNRRRESPSPIPSSLLSETKLSVARHNSFGDQSSFSESPKMSTPSPHTLSRASFAMSRGPSPLTLGLSDVVPLAVAFQEVIHACFRGADDSQCQVRMIGDMMISFPAGILPLLTNNINSTPLLFRLRKASGLDSVVPNKNLISRNQSLSTNDLFVFEFKMGALKELLRKQSEMNPNASYFNIDILKYQIQAQPRAASCPLQMVAYWKCTDTHTDLRLDFKYNSHALAQAKSLQNVSISAPIDGGVTNMQSKPNASWLPESNRALWKLPELSQDIDNGVGSLRGRFELSSGPGSQGTIAAQFNCEGTTLSNLSFELVGMGYRLSLEKKRFVSGKYYCDGNATSSENQHRYAVPPATVPYSEGNHLSS